MFFVIFLLELHCLDGMGTIFAHPHLHQELVDHCSDLLLSLGLHPPHEALKFLLLEALSFVQNERKKDGQLKILDHDGSSIQIRSTSFPERLNVSIRWSMWSKICQPKTKMSQGNIQKIWEAQQ